MPESFGCRSQLLQSVFIDFEDHAGVAIGDLAYFSAVQAI
jgi:hypothetical protein